VVPLAHHDHAEKCMALADDQSALFDATLRMISQNPAPATD